MNNRSTPKQPVEFFLPDFCQIQSLFLVLVIGELLAVIFTLLNFNADVSLWYLLGFYSISIQMISLVSVTSLCWLRPILAKYNDWISGAISLVIILLATLLFSFAVILWYWGASIDLLEANQRHFLLRNLLIAGLIGSVALRYFYLLQQYRKHLVLESSARLEALQARIRPHFLFNSMNVIASLTRIDPAKAESAIEDLSDLFRATLENKQELIPFSEELKNGERYLAIEKLRLGERLTISKKIDPQSLTTLLPPLSVQPLLENAVYHGIQMLPEGGEVSIIAHCNNGKLEIEITNPRTEQKNYHGNGIAIKNISQRLQMIYSGKASLTREVTENFYRVIMSIPMSNHSNN